MKILQVIKTIFSMPTKKRSFDAAKTTRLNIGFGGPDTSINVDLDGGIVALRSRARELCANNEFGRRFLSLVSNNVIGPKGPVLQVRRKDRSNTLDKPINDTVERHWRKWQKNCDVTGRMSFNDILRVGIKAVARDGETLIRFIRNPSFDYGFKIQLLEADRIDVRDNRRFQNGNVVRQGVEIDDTGSPIAVWVSYKHPGEVATTINHTERVPIGELIHLFRPERAEQNRGYSWLHAVLLRANNLEGYEDAAIVAARVGASKMGVFTKKMDDMAGNLTEIADGQNGNTLQMEAEAGEFIDLTGLPGTSLDSWNPDYPHQNFESFLKQCLRGWATGVDVATHNLTGDMTDVNYSSARIAELSERDSWVTIQEWFFERLVFKIYETFLLSGLMRDITFANSGKRIPLALYQDIVENSRFQGRRWEWVDPLKSAQSSREMIEQKLTSRTEIAASQGRDITDVIDELAQEQKMIDESGLTSEPAKTSEAKQDEV